jgi:uncharacterized protein (DUF1778 family)
MQSENPLHRRYGVIAAARLYQKNARLIDEAAAVEGGDVAAFLDSFLNSRRNAC